MSVAVRIAGGRGGRVSRAVAASVGAGAALQLLVAVSGVISARLLGVADRGVLALLWVVTIVTGQIATLGLHVAVGYAIAQGEPARALLGRLRGQIGLQLALAPLIAGAAMLAVVDHDSSTLAAGACMLVAASALIVLLYAIGVAQGERRYRAVQLHRLVQPLLFTVVLVALAIAGGGDLVAISAIWAATMVLAALLAWRHTALAWSRAGGHASEPGERRSARELRRFGRRSFLGTFGTTEHLMLDQLLVGVLLSPAGFGLYVAANAFANLPRFLGQSLGLVAYPEVASGAGTDRKRTLLRYALLGLAVTAPLVIGLLLTIGWLLPLLFGDAFEDAVPVARILLVAALLQSLRRVLTEGSRGLGTGVPGTVGEVAFAVVLVATAIPLAAEDGAEGAALAVLAAAAAGWLALLVALWRARATGPVDPHAGPRDPAMDAPEAPV